MKQVYARRVSFMSKSLLWSVLLYSAIMLVLNWEELLTRVKGHQQIVVKKTEEPAAPTPSVSYSTVFIDIVQLFLGAHR